MRRKYLGLLSFVLVIMVFLSGMCSDSVRTHSGVSCALFQISDARIISGHAGLSEVQFCTAGMLGVGNDTDTLQASGRPCSRGGEDGFPFGDLCPGITGLQSAKFFVDSEDIQFYIPYPKITVSGYIHKSDGKKRPDLSQ